MLENLKRELEKSEREKEKLRLEMHRIKTNQGKLTSKTTFDYQLPQINFQNILNLKWHLCKQTSISGCSSSLNPQGCYRGVKKYVTVNLFMSKYEHMKDS